MKIKIVIMMLLMFIIGFGIIISGCTISNEAKCEIEYKSCVHDCGEGILSSICKEKCTYDRKQCLDK
ncbi:MAG: hypothetical protein ABIH25_05675 [Candidatus Woesearchaeota archaeon]